ncbi:TPA: hypothetical protein ACH3X1_014595 [Trebouxia sp. C0004]
MTTPSAALSNVQLCHVVVAEQAVCATVGLNKQFAMQVMGMEQACACHAFPGSMDHSHTQQVSECLSEAELLWAAPVSGMTAHELNGQYAKAADLESCSHDSEPFFTLLQASAVQSQPYSTVRHTAAQHDSHQSHPIIAASQPHDSPMTTPSAALSNVQLCHVVVAEQAVCATVGLNKQFAMQVMGMEQACACHAFPGSMDHSHTQQVSECLSEAELLWAAPVSGMTAHELNGQYAKAADLESCSHDSEPFFTLLQASAVQSQPYSTVRHTAAQHDSHQSHPIIAASQPHDSPMTAPSAALSNVQLCHVVGAEQAVCATVGLNKQFAMQVMGMEQACACHAFPGSIDHSHTQQVSECLSEAELLWAAPVSGMTAHELNGQYAKAADLESCSHDSEPFFTLLQASAVQSQPYSTVRHTAAQHDSHQSHPIIAASQPHDSPMTAPSAALSNVQLCHVVVAEQAVCATVGLNKQFAMQVMGMEQACACHAFPGSMDHSHTQQVSECLSEAELLWAAPVSGMTAHELNGQYAKAADLESCSHDSEPFFTLLQASAVQSQPYSTVRHTAAQHDSHQSHPIIAASQPHDSPMTAPSAALSNVQLCHVVVAEQAVCATVGLNKQFAMQVMGMEQACACHAFPGSMDHSHTQQVSECLSEAELLWAASVSGMTAHELNGQYAKAADLESCSHDSEPFFTLLQASAVQSQPYSTVRHTAAQHDSHQSHPIIAASQPHDSPMTAPSAALSNVQLCHVVVAEQAVCATVGLNKQFAMQVMGMEQACACHAFPGSMDHSHTQQVSECLSEAELLWAAPVSGMTAHELNGQYAKAADLESCSHDSEPFFTLLQASAVQSQPYSTVRHTAAQHDSHQSHPIIAASQPHDSPMTAPSAALSNVQLCHVVGAEQAVCATVGLNKQFAMQVMGMEQACACHAFPGSIDHSHTQQVSECLSEAELLWAASVSGMTAHELNGQYAKAADLESCSHDSEPFFTLLQASAGGAPEKRLEASDLEAQEVRGQALATLRPKKSEDGPLRCCICWVARSSSKRMRLALRRLEALKALCLADTMVSATRIALGFF